MKKLLLLFCLSAIALISNAQLVITEISYNPPESNADSLEYIELFNTTSADVDLTGYIIADNTEHTIAAGTVPANGYAVLAINPNAMQSVLGVTAIEIADLALSNNGEGIILRNSDGNIIDEVGYDDEGDWPGFDEGTDGAGASIELCDVDSDNTDGTNWSVAANDLGVMVNGIAMLGTPAAANTASCEVVPDVTVQVTSNVFTPADITINVGETVRWENIEGFHNVNGSQATFPDNPDSFTSGAASSGWVYDHTFTVPGVYDYQCDPHANFGMVGTVTVEGSTEPEIPTYAIGLVNTVDNVGVPDSNGVECIIEGIVHGANLRPNGLQFALVDQSGEGIGLFAGSNLGYNYAEGDLIRVTGFIGHFNGLTQISASAVEFLSADNELIGPVMVDILGEETESRFVQINNLTVVDEAQWLGDGSSFNVDFTNLNGDIVTVRVDSDTEVANYTPDNWEALFRVRGIGGQFDNTEPHFDGYQLVPRYIDDINNTLSVEEIVGELNIYPNPVQDVLRIDADFDYDRFVIHNQVGQDILKGDNTRTIDVSALPNGLYLLILEKDNSIKTAKFIK